MRSILLIFAALVLAGVGFFVYLWTQPAVSGKASADNARAQNAIAPSSRPSNIPDAQQVLGPGERVWLKSYDDKTALLSQEFRAARLEPQKDGTIKVTEPEARFYMGREEPRQMLIVRGRRGRVIVPGNQSGAGDKFAARQPAAPTRGELHDVTLELFNTSTDASPALVCTMNNVSFD